MSTSLEGLPLATAGTSGVAQGYRGKRTGQTWASLGWMGEEQPPEVPELNPALADPAVPSTWGPSSLTPGSTHTHPQPPSHPLLTGSDPGESEDEETLVDPEEEAFLAQYRAAQASAAANTARAAGGLNSADPFGLPPPEQDQGQGQSQGQVGWTPAQVESFLLRRTLAPMDVRSITDLVRPVQGPAGAVAELMHLLRPLVYALLVRRYVLSWATTGSTASASTSAAARAGRSRSAWLPLGVAFLMDVLSRYLRRWSLDPHMPDPFLHPRAWAQRVVPGNPLKQGWRALMLRLVLSVLTGVTGGGGSAGGSEEQAVSVLESDEWSARSRDWAWYLLRGPLWTQVTRPRVEGLLGGLRSVPLLGLGAGLAEDYLPLVDRYHYFGSR